MTCIAGSLSMNTEFASMEGLLYIAIQIWVWNCGWQR